MARMKWSKKTYSTRTVIELLSIIAYFIVATLAILKWRIGYTETALIYWGGPSLYISTIRPAIIKKTALYSLLTIIPLSFIIDYIGHVSGSWFEPTALTGIRILGVFPADIFIWGFCYSYFVVSFYEYFFDDDRGKGIFSPRLKILGYTLAALVVAFSAVYFIHKEWLVITYFYILLVAGLFIIPFTVILWKYPHLFKKIVLQGLYFAVVSLIFEATALAVGQWQYLGQHYLGRVEMLGVMFPVEEALWILFAVPAYLCIYEYFADDRQ